MLVWKKLEIIGQQVNEQRGEQGDGQETPMTVELIAQARQLEDVGLEFESSEDARDRNAFTPLEKLEIQDVRRIIPRPVPEDLIHEDRSSVIGNIEPKVLYDSAINSSQYKGSDLSGASNGIYSNMSPLNRDSPVSTNSFVRPQLEKPIKSPVHQHLTISEIKEYSVSKKEDQKEKNRLENKKVFLPAKRLNLLDHSKRVIQKPDFDSDSESMYHENQDFHSPSDDKNTSS